MTQLKPGFEECENDKVLQHRPGPHKRQPRPREYFVSWKGMGPEERGFLSTSLVSLLMWCINTGTDCTLWPDLHLGLVKLPLRTRSMWTLLLCLQIQHLLSSRRGAGNLLRNAAAHLHASSTQRLLEANPLDNQHVCQSSTRVIFGAFLCAYFEGSPCTQLKHDCWPYAPHLCLPHEPHMCLRHEQRVSNFNE